jgi:hypothetical protein
LDTLRALPRVAEFPLGSFPRFCTFARFLRLAMITPLVLRNDTMLHGGKLSNASYQQDGGRPVEMLMTRPVTVQSRAAPIANLLAVALGAAAVGAIAIGAVAISRLAIDRAVIKRARFGKLEVDELTVRRLRVVENSAPIQ